MSTQVRAVTSRARTLFRQPSLVRCVNCKGYRITRGCDIKGGAYYGRDNPMPARPIRCRAFVRHPDVVEVDGDA